MMMNIFFCKITLLVFLFLLVYSLSVSGIYTVTLHKLLAACPVYYSPWARFTKNKNISTQRSSHLWRLW